VTALNFSFWTDDGHETGETRSKTTKDSYCRMYRGQLYHGYEALCAAVNQALDVSSAPDGHVRLHGCHSFSSGRNRSGQRSFLFDDHNRSTREDFRASRRLPSFADAQRTSERTARNGIDPCSGLSLSNEPVDKRMSLQRNTMDNSHAVCKTPPAVPSISCDWSCTDFLRFAIKPCTMDNEVRPELNSILSDCLLFSQFLQTGTDPSCRPLGMLQWTWLRPIHRHGLSPVRWHARHARDAF
jgi:hypothetical protein